VSRAAPRAGRSNPSFLGQNDSAALHLAALAALIAGALSLGFAGLIPVAVCLLTLVLIMVMGLAVPRWAPQFRHDSPQRTVLALAVLGLLVAATAGSGPGALFSGQLSGALSTAVAELSLPAGVPIGLLAALAAGALVAVALELAERRGIQSALVLGIAVLGLASVAAPGWHLLPGVLLGWPATLFALTKLAGPGVAANFDATTLSKSVSKSDSGGNGTSDRLAEQPISPTSIRSARVVARWHALPILSAITLSLIALLLAVLTGGTSAAPQAGGWNPGSGGGSSSGNRVTSDYLGGEMNLSARGTLGSEPVLEVTDSSPRLWRAGTLDQYNGRGWLTSQPPNGLPTLVGDEQTPGSVTVIPAPASLAGTPGPTRCERSGPVRLRCSLLVS
jgi:hypothetical protein